MGHGRPACAQGRRATPGRSGRYALTLRWTRTCLRKRRGRIQPIRQELGRPSAATGRRARSRRRRRWTLGSTRPRRRPRCPRHTLAREALCGHPRRVGSSSTSRNRIPGPNLEGGAGSPTLWPRCRTWLGHLAWTRWRRALGPKRATGIASTRTDVSVQASCRGPREPPRNLIHAEGGPGAGSRW